MEPKLTSRRLMLPTLALAAAAALSGCVVAPYPAHRVAYYEPPYTYESEVAVTTIAPPAPYVEVRPVVPFAGAVWLDGYWGWSGGRHVWVGGRWEHPRPGYAWAPHRWVQGGGQWHLRAGGWVRR